MIPYRKDTGRREICLTQNLMNRIFVICKLLQNAVNSTKWHICTLDMRAEKSTISHSHHLNKLELNGGKSMLCWWWRIALDVARSICHLGLFQVEGISISSHLQVIVTVQQFAIFVCVLWQCGALTVCHSTRHLKICQAVTGVFKLDERLNYPARTFASNVVLSCSSAIKITHRGQDFFSP